MITDDFDTSEPVMTLHDFYGEKKHIVNTCLIVFSEELHRYLLTHFPCEEIGCICACNGSTPIYRTVYQGREIAFYLTMIGSAMASSGCIEANWLTGADKFVMFGSCGSLDRDSTLGRFIVPTQAYRGEGASYYHVPPADYITIRTSDRLAAIFDEMDVPYVQGRVWTTESMLRETRGLVKKRREEGCIAVEMELAGVEAACDYYGFTLYDFLEAGDVLADSGYEVEGLKDANHSLGKLMIALEVAKRIADD